LHSPARAARPDIGVILPESPPEEIDMSDRQDARDFRHGVALDELREGEPLPGTIDGAAAVLVRRGEQVFAVGGECSHYHAPLADGLVVGDTLRCPWHHACFALDGGAAIGPPALTALACWQTTLADGRVTIGERRPAASPSPQTDAGRVVIVGAGAAGEAAAWALREQGHGGSITLLGDEAGAPVDRPNLSKDYLAGQAPEDWLPLRGDTDYAERGIELHRDAEVSRIDRDTRRVFCTDGRDFAYDQLLLATGAAPLRPPIPMTDELPTLTLRTVADARAIIAAVEGGVRRVAVIGASFIGLEVAASLRARKVEVIVIGSESVPMGQLFGARLGGFLRELHEQHGVHFRLGHRAQAVESGGVRLDDGSLVEAGLVVLGAGVRPRTELARAAGLQVDNGIVVDRRLRSSVERIYAAGDVARFPDAHGEHLRIEHWVVAQRQGRIAARNMLGQDVADDTPPFFWSQHYDVSLNFVGHASPEDLREEDGDPRSGDYACRFLRAGRAVALLTIGRDRASLAFEAGVAAV
jgi:NAD(P)H-nitrite reductase